MSAARVLIVDDDPNILEVLQTRLEASGFAVRTARGGEEALATHRETPADAIITDLRMPGVDGLELLHRLREFDREVPVILLTAHGSIPEAVRAMRDGAYDFLVKPYSGGDLVALLRRALERVVPTAARAERAGDLIAESPAMRRLAEMIERVAPTPTTVLITGESGTGKELVARTLHRLSTRAAAPLVVIDCGALPDTLLESELFGHRRGSFTSATQDKKGLLEEADGATVFLDEIGNISPPMQTRLLRFLQSGEVRRIGDLGPRRVDVRVIAATNRDLARATREGDFREDLYYRLKVVTLVLPPLRERREEVEPLAQHFLGEVAGVLRRREPALDPAALAALKVHDWPGNVRELKYLLEAAVALAAGSGTLTLEDLRRAEFSGPAPETETSSSLSALEQAEKAQILQALRDNGWVQKRAADTLGISGRVIHYKIRKYGIALPKT